MSERNYLSCGVFVRHKIPYAEKADEIRYAGLGRKRIKVQRDAGAGIHYRIQAEEGADARQLFKFFVSRQVADVQHKVAGRRHTPVMRSQRCGRKLVRHDIFAFWPADADIALEPPRSGRRTNAHMPVSCRYPVEIRAVTQAFAEYPAFKRGGDLARLRGEKRADRVDVNIRVSASQQLARIGCGRLLCRAWRVRGRLRAC